MTVWRNARAAHKGRVREHWLAARCGSPHQSAKSTFDCSSIATRPCGAPVYPAKTIWTCKSVHVETSGKRFWTLPSYGEVRVCQSGAQSKAVHLRRPRPCKNTCDHL